MFAKAALHSPSVIIKHLQFLLEKQDGADGWLEMATHNPKRMVVKIKADLAECEWTVNLVCERK